MQLQLPKGTRDLSQEQAIARNEIVNTLKKVFELYGYGPLETPIFERYEVLASKYAGGDEILKETFKFKDQGDRELGLRYDLTVPTCRFVGMNPNIKLPFKRYQIGEVFRDGPVEKARYRQFTQCDVDIIGNKSMSSEAEIIALAKRAFKELGLEVIIKVNNRRLLNNLLDYAGVKKDKHEAVILSIDKLEKFGMETVKKELEQKKIDKKTISKIEKVISIKGNNKAEIGSIKEIIKNSDGLKEIEELFSLLKIFSIDVDFDVSLARGLAYYTGTVVEVFVKSGNVKSAVCGGGRYDNMIANFLGKGSYPAVGISFGLDRIYDAYIEKNTESKKTVTQVYIAPINALNESIKIAEELRNNGINVDIDLTGKGPSKNLKYASTINIPYVLFIGEEELKQKKVKIRDMKTGNEKLLGCDELGIFLQKKAKD